MTSGYDIERLRDAAEEILRRANEDEEFKRRLSEDSRAVLDEAGLPGELPEYLRPFGGDRCFECVDFTCIFTLCPSTCLPGGTHDMTTLTDV